MLQRPILVGLVRICIALISVLWLGLAGTGRARAEIVMIDAAGRSVRLAEPAKRIVTNESLLLITLGLIDDDPVSKLAGWAAPRRLDSGIYSAFRSEYPAIDKIPVVGGVVPSTSSAEGILSVKPDLFVVSLWEPGWREITEVLEQANVPVLFLDSLEAPSLGPAEATAMSVKLLGLAIGRSEKADGYADFVRSHYQDIASRLSENTARPKVLIDAHAGGPCCSVPGAANRLTELVALAGGESVGSDTVQGYDGRLNVEAVLGINPDVYIGTGGPHLAPDGLVLGGGYDVETARASLKKVVSKDLRSELTAVQSGRAHAVSHQLAISALSVLTLESFATWIHPELQSKIDPDRTLAEINRRFIAVPLQGTFWVNSDDKVVHR